MSKIIFANQLRGLAAMFVAGSHLVGVFWAMRDFVGLATATPVQEWTPPAVLTFFSHPWLNFGPFGVGVFFLISGLVIPISLEQHSRGSFLVARVLRIYPTYVFVLLLEVAVLHINAAYWSKPFPYGNWTIISNALLIYNAVGQPSIDMVNWTLCVELKFYLLMALLAPQVRRGSQLPLLLIGLAIVAANAALNWYPFAAGGKLRYLAGQFSIESTFMIFMLIGALFNFHLRGLLRRPAFVAGCAGMFGLFVISWTQSSIGDQYPIVTVNYLYALFLFAVLYSLRTLARPLKVFDFVASISFPFYLIHSLIGYSILKFLMLHLHVAYAPAVCITLAVLVAMAAGLHFTIEIKSIAIGKRLALRRVRPGLSPLEPSKAPAA